MFSQTEFVNLTISFRLFSKRLQAILTCSARRKLQENSNGCKLLGKVLATDSLQAWPWQNRRKPDTSGHQIRSERTCASHVFPRGSFLAGAPGEDHGSLDPSGVQRNWRQGRMASYGLIVSVEISPKMGGH